MFCSETGMFPYITEFYYEAKHDLEDSECLALNIHYMHYALNICADTKN